MSIPLKFEAGDIAYLHEKAKVGRMSPVKIISIKTRKNSAGPSIWYQVYGTDIYQPTWYREDQLKSFSEAKSIALDYLNREIQKLQQKYDELEGDFTPLGSQFITI